tara:strand:- start:4822 stop:5418 length:597 start_codon:yes stop_codon:yes gene_type:complete
MNLRKEYKKEYAVYHGIKARCYNKNRQFWYLYGGRGIVMCQRWLDGFENFISDMGARPSDKHSIDRINPNGNYEPENCRWATHKEQAKTKRKLIVVNCINCGKKTNGRSWRGLCGGCNEYKRRNGILRPKKRGDVVLIMGDKMRKRLNRKIVQMDLDGKEVDVFISITLAMKKYGTGIMNCLSGRSLTSYGYKWKYKQ